MFSGSSGGVSASRSELNALINSEKMPLLFKKEVIKQVRDPNNLPTLQDIYNEYNELESVINILKYRSSYRIMSMMEVAGALTIYILAVAAMMTAATMPVAFISFMSKSGNFHPRRNYAAVVIPDQNITCHELYPISNDWNDDKGHAEWAHYCYKKYDHFWNVAAWSYVIAIISSLGASAVILVLGVAVTNISDDFPIANKDLTMEDLKSKFRSRVDAICTKYGVSNVPESKPATIISNLEAKLPIRHKFFSLVGQTQNVHSCFSRIPADITLLIAAYADLTDKKIKERVIDHSLTVLRSFEDSRPPFSSAFYAPNETPAMFDANISAAAAAAAPAGSYLSDAIVEPELYEGLRSGR